MSTPHNSPYRCCANALRSSLLLASVLFTGMHSATSAADEGKHTAAPAPGARLFGSAMPAGPATPLAAAIAAGTGSEARKISGEVREVCQKEGCWLILADGTAWARVRTKDHAFLVHKNLSGRVEVFGVLSEKVNDKAMQEHLARDDKSKFVTPREYLIVAQSVQKLD